MTALVLWLLIDRTEFGVRLRAAQSTTATWPRPLGIRTQVDLFRDLRAAVGLGAFGGVVGAELLPIEPFYALRYMVTFLVVVSVGGAGVDPRRAVGIAVAGPGGHHGKYLAPEFGEFFFYLAVIVIVFLFPHGLFGRAH